MKQVIRELEQVRRRGLILLLVQRFFQWNSAILAIALFLGITDYLLRLPAVLRLVIGVTIAGVALVWLARRCMQALGFRPDLSILALRAEQMYPQLAGALASTVEFATNPDDYSDPQRMETMAKASIKRVENKVDKVSFGKLIDMTQTLRLGAIVAVVVLVFGGVVVAAGENSLLAAKRWFTPLSDVEWPRRTEVASLVKKNMVSAADTPVEISARVDRGYRKGMRTWVNYRLLGTDGRKTSWHSELMNEVPRTGDPRFEQMIDTSGLYADVLPTGEQVPAEGITLEFYIEAGDHRTDMQTVILVPRPAVQSVTVHITPPDYAKGLKNEQKISLHQQAGRIATTSAMQYSTVDLHIELNKPVPDPDGDWAKVLPGLAQLKGAKLVANLESSGANPSLHLSFLLDESVQSTINLLDEHGISNLSERVYRIESIKDKPPFVSMVEPRSDESVLPTAIVELEAVAKDDVGVELIRLESEVPTRKAAEPAEGEEAQKEPVKVEPTILDKTTGRNARLTTDYVLDLTPLKLQPGDEVVLTAVAQDVFALNDKRHDLVRSAPRRLRVIDEAALISQIRKDLAGIRHQAIRLEGKQNKLSEAGPSKKSASQQGQLSQSIERQKEMADALKDRIARNKLNEGALNKLIERAGGLLDKASKASKQAGENLDKAQKAGNESQKKQNAAEAKDQQQKASAALKDLVTLLDQGRDALALQLQLRDLKTKQEGLIADARKLMPKTLGQDPNKLDPKTKRELNDLANRQKNLSNQAKNLVQQMQSTADNIAKQSKRPQDQATAQALADAARIAQRQGLNQLMQQAAQKAQQNQMATAGQRQQEAKDVLDKMLEEMKNQEKRRQEILKRLVAKLAEALRNLIAQQTAQIALLEDAKKLGELDAPMAQLRRNTMAVEEQANSARETVEVGEIIGKAVESQASAIQGLRANLKEPAQNGEKAALAHLEAALKRLNELQEQNKQDQAQEEREKLRGEYLKLVTQQKSIRDETKKIVELDKLTRRERAKLVAMAEEQTAIRDKAAELGGKVEETLIFKRVHGRIDATAEQVIEQLQQARAESLLVARESKLVNMLQILADALKRDQDQDEFNRPQNPGGGGGQQPPGQGKPPLVPPVAELKALRGVQVLIYDMTKELEKEILRTGSEAHIQEILQLGREQQELHEDGQTLVDQLKQQAQQQQQQLPGRIEKPGDVPVPPEVPEKPAENE